jgi:hypothetical protein
MFRALPPALVTAFLFLAACGGGGDPPTPTVDFDAAARAAANDALVTLDDLPQFWVEGTQEDQNANVVLSRDCDVFDPQVGFPGAAAIEQSPVYLGTGERQATFITAAYREEADAVTVIDGQAALVDRCYDEFLDAIEQAARDAAAEQGVELGALSDIDVGLEEIEFPPLGDETRVRRASVSVTVVIVTTDFDLDIIVVRSGRMMGAMTYSNFEFIDSEEEESIARAMTAKLAAADATLPD